MNQEILQRLDTLAAKLGVTAIHLWGVLLRQAQVEAISDICWLIASGWVVVICWRVFKRSFRSDNEDAAAVMVCSVIGGIVSVIIWISCAMSLPTELLNPEYWALDKVLRLIGK